VDIAVLLSAQIACIHTAKDRWKWEKAGWQHRGTARNNAQRITAYAGIRDGTLHRASCHHFRPPLPAAKSCCFWCCQYLVLVFLLLLLAVFDAMR
jgi:hypothetical protein